MEKAKKVSESRISKIVESAGLKPIKGSWKRAVNNYYNRWEGSSSTTEYELRTEEGITLNGTKYSGDTADFDVCVKTRSQLEKARLLAEKMTSAGFQTDVTVVFSKEARKRKLAIIQKIDNADIFEDELDALEKYLKEFLV